MVKMRRGGVKQRKLPGRRRAPEASSFFHVKGQRLTGVMEWHAAGTPMQKPDPESRHDRRVALYRGVGVPATAFELFPLTMRPRVSMDDMVVPPTVRVYLPVTRIDRLYYGQDKKLPTMAFCGKFYYVEPSSRVMLDLGRTAIFPTKISALHEIAGHMFKLREKNKTRLPRVLWEWMDEHSIGMNEHTKMLHKMTRDNATYAHFLVILNDVLKGKYPWSILYKSSSTTQLLGTEYYDRFLENGPTFAIQPSPNNWLQKEWVVPLAYPCAPSDTMIRLGTRNEHWMEFSLDVGQHDFVDQILCHLVADTRGTRFDTLIDTFVFQHEIGENRSVSEILDTRSNSYSFLKYVHTTPFHALQGNELSATVHSWFVPDDFKAKDNRSCTTVWQFKNGLFQEVTTNVWKRLQWPAQWRVGNKLNIVELKVAPLTSNKLARQPAPTLLKKARKLVAKFMAEQWKTRPRDVTLQKLQLPRSVITAMKPEIVQEVAASLPVTDYRMQRQE